MPNETIQTDVETTMLQRETCEMCGNVLGQNAIICDLCIRSLFDVACESCNEPVIPNWTGEIGPMPFTWRRSQTLVGYVSARLERRPHRAGMVVGPFQLFAFPELAFAPVLQRIVNGNETHSGTYVCDECGWQCEDCNEWHEAEHEADECCNPDRQCDECGEWYEFPVEASRCCGGRLVHDYSWNPQFRFFGDNGALSHATNGILYLGVELEMEHALEHMQEFYDNADESYEHPQFVWAKHDGSLGDYGVELVTHPATLDAFRSNFPFRALEMLNERGARSYGTGTCGMHIHVARSAFQDAPHVWRFVKLQTWNVAMCETVAQRPSCEWARWTSDGSIDNSGESLPAMIKGKSSNHARYVALNFQNRETIELRYFRGNLRSDAIRARVEFVHAMWEYTRNLTVRDVRANALRTEPFMAWIRANHAQYATLVAFVNDRGL